MNQETHIRAELRAVREELSRRDLDIMSSLDHSLLAPSLDDRFLRLQELSTEQLKEHENRLEQDLEDLKTGFETPSDSEADDVTTESSPKTPDE